MTVINQTGVVSPRHALRSLVSNVLFLFFFFNDPATTEIYTLPLHAALPILERDWAAERRAPPDAGENADLIALDLHAPAARSEEHTSELQSRLHLVCRLLLEKKKEYHAETETPIFEPVTEQLHTVSDPSVTY